VSLGWLTTQADGVINVRASGKGAADREAEMATNVLKFDHATVVTGLTVYAKALDRDIEGTVVFDTRYTSGKDYRTANAEASVENYTLPSTENTYAKDCLIAKARFEALSADLRDRLEADLKNCEDRRTFLLNYERDEAAKRALAVITEAAA
jgi:hypothetical protein